jgi:anaerobic magnesium-protoporphyrin IX monomethyl ester cyclase
VEITLVGADFEENLGVGMIAATAVAAGHRVRVMPFNEARQIDSIARKLTDANPRVVGLSIQFQHRAREFLKLATSLRKLGYAGHITCGGQFPTLAFKEVLEDKHGIDSVVLHEGEATFVKLLRALENATPYADVPGLACLNSSGNAQAGPTPALGPLDDLPFPARYRGHSQHMGVPFVPILGSRGCWGACSYCSITSFYRDAKSMRGGRMLRHRSPENIAAEMAMILGNVGGKAIFCFHDDNFLLPRPEASVARIRAIKETVDAYGAGRVGMIGKCRPDSLTPELTRELRELGVIRLYVGVENMSSDGSKHLNRRMQTDCVRSALAACRQEGIFGCYNLLIFEPDAKLQDIEDNIAFIREHASHPVNFCRAEPYHGTPLQIEMASRNTLGGTYLGYDYRIEDDRTELLFRICAAAFRERNFAASGVHNRYMGLGYNAKLLEYFYRDTTGHLAELMRECETLTRDIALETAGFLEEALALAKSIDLADRERIERETALLGLRIAAADRFQHARLDQLYAAMSHYSKEDEQPVLETSSRKQLFNAAKRIAQSAALGTMIGAWSLSACSDTVPVVDPVPSDARADFPPMSDPLPPDSGMDSLYLDDPAPADMMVADPPPPDGMVVDMLPPDQGVDQWLIADPLPPDSGADEFVPFEALPSPDPGFDEQSSLLAPDADQTKTNVPIDQWRDTSPKRQNRTEDLPFYHPPAVKLSGIQTPNGVKVSLLGGPAAISTRWEGDGEIEGEGRQIIWRPHSDIDQIRVAVRSKGGVAVVALRSGEIDA